MISYPQNSRDHRSAVATSSRWVSLSGIALGTTYQITYQSNEPGNYDLEITLLLRQFSGALSVYEPGSELSRFNRMGALRFESPFLYPVLRASAEVFALTSGAFDPTVGPLVDVYGFGPAGRQTAPSVPTDEVRLAVGFSHIRFDEEYVERTRPNIQLNVNAIAKGYAVDVVGQFLEAQGIERYLIEIGGEVRGRGLNPQDQSWRIGIASPEVGGEWDTIISLVNQSVATSGNYHNRYQRDGVTYTHLITPQTGLMTLSDLVSVTVMAEECMMADALATAFMVMGGDETALFLRKYPQWRAHLIPAPTRAS